MGRTVTPAYLYRFSGPPAGAVAGQLGLRPTPLFKYLAGIGPGTMADVTLNPPSRRACLDCGRVDVWDGDAGEWRIHEANGERKSGDPFCLHEWDITGTHRPVREATPG